ncbi:hypothetical protein [Pseudomonas sp. DE0157]|uniref:hypothetical protein n=1 Tax=Pseudomonas sp. DE0157 TaxID=2584952 RepID=UPI0011A5B699|nr:hypothetical protein [Pseudomonas sp. DE0157]
MNNIPFPCFFGIEEILQLDAESLEYESPYVLSQLQACAAEARPLESYAWVKSFLQANAVATRYTVYRAAAERLLLWCLLVLEKPVTELDEIDIRCFMDFCLCPPDHWIAQSPEKRLMRASAKRSSRAMVVNPAWRPFRPSLSTSQIEGDQVKITSSSILAGVMTVINQFYLHLAGEDVLDKNPAHELHRSRQYAPLYAVHEGKRCFNASEWREFVAVAEAMAEADPGFERKLFMIITVYYLQLQPSEIELFGKVILMKSLCRKDDGTYRLDVPHFPALKHVMIPSEYVERWVARFRTYLGTHMTPLSLDPTPLISTQSGRGGISSRHANLIFKSICNQVVMNLENLGVEVPDDSPFRNASLLWLRETSLMRLAEFLPFDHFRLMVRGSTSDNVFARYYAWHPKYRAR